MFGWLKRRTAAPERRASGFTAEVIAMRESWISGARGLAELTATAQSCVSLWEGAFALADVTGTPMLDRQAMAQIGRGLALRGEALFLIRDHLVPCTDWEVRTRDGRPTAYRLSVPEASGGRSVTALAGEVLHVRIGCDPSIPWIGTAPLRRASLSAELLDALERALGEVFTDAPLGSRIVPLPDAGADDMESMRGAFRGKRGKTLIVEGVGASTAAGMNPQIGQRSDDLSPNLAQSMAVEALREARDGVASAYGVLPGLLNRAATGPVVREAQRHLATWTLQPIAALLAEEAGHKLGGAVQIDTLTPLQAFDAGGRARALSALVKSVAEAKEAGIDPSAALALVGWEQADPDP